MPAFEAQAPRQPIREMPRGDGEDKHRNELGQPNPAHIKRAVVLGLVLPADGRLEYLQAHVHAEDGKPPQPEVTVFKSWSE